MSGLHPVLRLETGQFSHPGRRRRNNEDWLGTFQPEDPERLDRKGSLFLVADGMGGHQNGEIASRLAVDHVIRAYVEDPGANVQVSLQRAIELANEAVHAESGRGQEGRRWGTTLVAAVVRYDELWIANVGDSRAYLLRDGTLRQLSQDHTWASAGSGDIPSGDWIGRHIITRGLGLKPSVEIDLFPPVKLRAHDRVLLCSDGLTTPLSDNAILDIAARRPPQQAVEALVTAANARGGPDNISVILVHVAERQAALTWQTPIELLAALVRPQTWQLAIEGILEFLLDGQGALRSPLVIAAILLLVAVVIGLGFVLGLLIF